LALIDTGPFVALLDPRDVRHRVAAQVVRDEPTAKYSTWPVITEALHFLGLAARRRHASAWDGQLPLIEYLARGGITVPDFTDALGVRSLAPPRFVSMVGRAERI
jgi:predicted nucleic acid-binding protein